MRSGSRSKVLWMAALLPLFAASVLPAQLRTLICRVTGAVMEVERCCPAAPTPQALSAAGTAEDIPARLSEPGCCVVETIDLGTLVAEDRADGVPPSSVGAISETPMAGMAVAARLSPRWSASQDRPPPVGPPLLLVKRSFLI